MKKVMLASFLVFLFIFTYFNIPYAIAARPLPQQCNGQQQCPGGGLVPCGGICCPCQLCDFFVMFERIYRFVLFTIIPPLATLMVVIGGFFYITAYLGIQGGSGEESIKTANSLFKNVAIGLLIVYGAHIFITFFLWAIQYQGAGDWWKVCPKN